MSVSGEELRENNEQIIYFLNLLKSQRQEIDYLIEKQEEEKNKLEMEIERIYYKLTLICKSLATRKKARVYYDQTIKELEEHYKKIVESSGVLLNSVKMGAGQLEEIMDKKTGTATIEGNRQVTPVKKDPQPEEEEQKEQGEITRLSVGFHESEEQEPDKEQMVAEKLPLNTYELLAEPIPGPRDSELISLSSIEPTLQNSPLHKLKQTRESLTESTRESKNPSTIGIDSIIQAHNQTSSKEELEKKNMEIKDSFKKTKKDLKNKHKAVKHKQEVPKQFSQDSTISQQSDNKTEESDEIKKVPKRRSHSESHTKSSESTNSTESGKIHKKTSIRSDEKSQESNRENSQSEQSGSKLSESSEIPQIDNVVTEMPIEENELLLVEKYQESDADTLYEDPLAPPSLPSSVSTISFDDGPKINQKGPGLAVKNKRVSHDLISKATAIKPTTDNVVVLKARNKDSSILSISDTRKLFAMPRNKRISDDIPQKSNADDSSESMTALRRANNQQHGRHTGGANFKWHSRASGDL